MKALIIALLIASCSNGGIPDKELQKKIILLTKADTVTIRSFELVDTIIYVVKK